jgi:signal peptidase II
MTLSWAIAAVIFCADFLIKTYLRLNYPNNSFTIIPKVFDISVVFNTGAAFGVLREQTNLLIYIGIVFLLVFLLLIRSEKHKDKFFFIACGLILGGAASNLYDRIVLGYVVDYLDFHVWPVFNLSDSCISVGIAMLLWQSFQRRPSPTDNHLQESNPSQENK